jgi:transcriptional regulator GlxA family with amidase domain
MRRIGALIFPGFELLDMFGPLEMFGLLKDEFEICMVAEDEGAVPSAQGPKAIADATYETKAKYDLVLVPGGRGARREVDNPATLSWLKTVQSDAELMLSVCTGSALLAKTGLLDGLQATTNKAAFDWVAGQGPKVKWVKQARWVKDGDYFTSSGVSAGMDMSLAVISHLLGEKTAEQVAIWAEYDWHQDLDWDPFAAIHGLV